MSTDADYDGSDGSRELDVICDMGDETYALLSDAKDDGYVCPEMTMYKCVYLCLLTPNCTYVFSPYGTQTSSLNAITGLCVIAGNTEVVDLSGYSDIEHADDCDQGDADNTVLDDDTGISVCDVKAWADDASNADTYPIFNKNGNHGGDPDFEDSGFQNGVKSLFIYYVKNHPDYSDLLVEGKYIS